MMVKSFGVKHISSGDLLRVSTSEPVQSAIKAGGLVPDDVVEQVVLPELEKHNHWLLDGYPRTLAQAKSLVKQQQIDMLLNLDVPDETIVERLYGRWVHVNSGRIYHTLFNPPKVEKVDDITGEPLVQREDDHPDVVRKRLNVYHAQTNPLLDYFEQMNVLKRYTGTESKVIWPQIQKDVEDYMRRSL